MELKKVSNKPLLGQDFKDQDLLKVLDEGEQKEMEYQGKKSLKFLLGLEFPNAEKKKMLLNNTSFNNLIDAYGNDSAKWVGKEVRVHVVKQMVGKEMKEVVYLTHPNRDLSGDIILD